MAQDRSKEISVQRKTFRATLVRSGKPLQWVIIDIPFSVAEAWGTRGMLRVKGEVNGFPFRTSLFPRKTGKHFMMVNKAVQRAANISAGSTARFTLEPDLEKRVVAVPTELERILKREKDLRRFFNALNESTRKELASQVAESKLPATRMRRAEQIAERMMNAMLAEHDLPPVLQKAFAEIPHAHQGWELMTRAQRRSHLLAIFWYQSPEARTRRAEKTIEAAVQAWERKNGK